MRAQPRSCKRWIKTPGVTVFGLFGSRHSGTTDVGSRRVGADRTAVASASGSTRPLPVSQQWQLPGWPAQIVSRLRAGVELAEHFVHGVDDRLRFFQLNRVT